MPRNCSGWPFAKGRCSRRQFIWHGADTLLQDAARPILGSLRVAIAEYGWLVILSGESSWTADNAFPECVFQSVAVPVPDVPLRTAVWQRTSPSTRPTRIPGLPNSPAGFRLTPERIRAAVERPTTRAEWSRNLGR